MKIEFSICRWVQKSLKQIKYEKVEEEKSFFYFFFLLYFHEHKKCLKSERHGNSISWNNNDEQMKTREKEKNFSSVKRKLSARRQTYCDRHDMNQTKNKKKWKTVWIHGQVVIIFRLFSFNFLYFLSTFVHSIWQIVFSTEKKILFNSIRERASWNSIEMVFFLRTKRVEICSFASGKNEQIFYF